MEGCHHDYQYFNIRSVLMLETCIIGALQLDEHQCKREMSVTLDGKRVIIAFTHNQSLVQ